MPCCAPAPVSRAVAAHRSRLLSGGATAAVLAILFGAIVGPRLPEASSAGLLDYRGHGGGSSQIVDISPLLGIGDQLRQPKPVQLFTVTASTQARWRLMALDQFNGAYWGLPETTTTSSIPADSGPHLANVQHRVGDPGRTRSVRWAASSCRPPTAPTRRPTSRTWS